MKLKNFQKVLDNTPEEVTEHVKMSMDILDRIHELLDEKFDGKQKLLAEKMGKTEAEVSKWLSGIQNFTTKTLVKLQVAFGESIIAVCTKSNNATFIQGRAYKQDHMQVSVDREGIKETRQYKNVKFNVDTQVINNNLPA